MPGSDSIPSSPSPASPDSTPTVGATPPTIQLTTAIEALSGVGPRRGASFRRLGIRCVADLVRHLPMRYDHELGEHSVADAGALTGPEYANEAAALTIRGEITAARLARGRRTRFEATLQDETGATLLTWFNASWLKGKLHPGMHIRATGRVRRYGDALQMINPRWELDETPAETPRAADGRLRAVYPASEDLTSNAIAGVINRTLAPALALITDHLDSAYRERRDLPPLADAYRMVHQPETDDDAARGRRRLAFDELLMLQLAVMLKRRHRRDTLQAPPLRCDETIDAHIARRFPFSLTEAQRTVIDEITADLTTAVPMNRLLQGDVGAGKTVVALYAMLLAVAEGHQAALMAPTELLAEQHFMTIQKMLAGSQVRLELLTGSLGAAARRALLDDLEDGTINLLVGTHALLTESVRFQRLAVVIVDEQHRFGVHQRASLRTKARGDDDDDGTTEIPHTLVMTATPIPRTMSLTVFGDLDISTIRHLPPGRRPVITRALNGARRPRAYEFARSRIEQREQVFVVVPVIDESDSGLTDVGTHLEYLRQGPLAGCRIEALHGRLKREERDAIMTRFREGALDALVATTVIEVGVDVPQATVMIIEHADRFGLAQLHQLRGRIGRGQKRGVCILVTDPTTDDGRARIEAITATNDGFEVAERDLAIRGPGELFGARQSGLAPFFAASLPRDMELLRLARRDAIEWIAENPALTGSRDALLRSRLLKAHGQALGLGDVG